MEAEKYEVFISTDPDWPGWGVKRGSEIVYNGGSFLTQDKAQQYADAWNDGADNDDEATDYVVYWYGE